LLSDVHKLKKFPFDYIFLDESQAIKNPQSMRYKASRLLQSRNRVVLTGTPIENNTFDLFAQFSFAVPGIFGSVKHFRDEYSTPIDKFKDFGRAKELQEKINPFLLRRTKKQVAKELPEKTEMVLYCEMGEEQRAVYDSQRTEIRDSLLSRDRKEFDINKSMLLLAGLTKLRQICDSPKILPDDLDYGAESAKMTVLLEEIRNKHKHHKILVFSQFVTMLDLIRIELDKEEISHEYLTGKSKKREEIVHRFQNDEEVRVFLISLKAGGTGLNLTEADYVYIVDPWWNPAVENQAIDRSYRIGQKKNVVAVRLICPDTIEDKIMTLQESKRELAEDLVRTDASVLKSLSKSDLVSLFE
jgi:SNF2 family DNA or RNA helicase